MKTETERMSDHAIKRMVEVCVSRCGNSIPDQSSETPEAAEPRRVFASVRKGPLVLKDLNIPSGAASSLGLKIWIV